MLLISDVCILNGPARGAANTPADHFTTAPFREGTAMPRQSTGTNSSRLPGPQNPNWKGGRSVASNGYVLIKVGTAHHLADVRGYAYEHRLVAEQKISRRLLPGEQVHHKNENKQDNRPENLEVMASGAEHFVHHRAADSNLRLPGEPNPVVECACGCGGQFERYDAFGRPRGYVPGHNPPDAPAMTAVLAALAGGPLSVKAVAMRLGAKRAVVGTTMYKLLSRGLITRTARGVYAKAEI